MLLKSVLSKNVLLKFAELECFSKTSL